MKKIAVLILGLVVLLGIAQVHAQESARHLCFAPSPESMGLLLERAVAQSQGAEGFDNRAVQFVAGAFNEGRFARVESFVSPSVFLRQSAVSSEGIGSFEEWVITNRGIVPDLEFVIQDELDAGSLIRVRYLATGTFDSAAFDQQSSALAWITKIDSDALAHGDQLVLEGTLIFHLEQGKLIEVHDLMPTVVQGS